MADHVPTKAEIRNKSKALFQITRNESRTGRFSVHNQDPFQLVDPVELSPEQRKELSLKNQLLESIEVSRLELKDKIQQTTFSKNDFDESAQRFLKSVSEPLEEIKKKGIPGTGRMPSIGQLRNFLKLIGAKNNDIKDLTSAYNRRQTYHDDERGLALKREIDAMNRIVSFLTSLGSNLDPREVAVKDQAEASGIKEDIVTARQVIQQMVNDGLTRQSTQDYNQTEVEEDLQDKDDDGVEDNLDDLRERLDSDNVLDKMNQMARDGNLPPFPVKDNVLDKMNQMAKDGKLPPFPGAPPPPVAPVTPPSKPSRPLPKTPAKSPRPASSSVKKGLESPLAQAMADRARSQAQNQPDDGEDDEFSDDDLVEIMKPPKRTSGIPEELRTRFGYNFGKTSVRRPILDLFYDKSEKGVARGDSFETFLETFKSEHLPTFQQFDGFSNKTVDKLRLRLLDIYKHRQFFNKQQGSGVKTKKGALTISNGKLGSLTIDMKAFKNMILKAKKNGKIVAQGPISSDLYDLLTKQFSSKRQYDPQAVEAFKQLIKISNLPIMNGDGKSKIVQGRIKPVKATTPKKESKKVSYIYYESADELLERLKIVLGQIDSGNQATQLVEEASQISGILKNKKVLSQVQYNSLMETIM